MSFVGARRTLISKKKAAAALPGPPTLAYVGGATGSTSSNTNTYTGIGIGTASANRLVIFALTQAISGSSAILSSATVNGSSSGVSVVNLANDSSTITFDLVIAAIPSGTTANLVATYSNSLFSIIAGCQVYTTDLTTLVSQTPASSGLALVSSGTSMTQTFSVSQGGSAILSMFSAFGITNGSQSFTTPNTYGIAADSNPFAAMTGHVNNVAANASAQVSATWTTATSAGCFVQAIFR